MRVEIDIHDILSNVDVQELFDEMGDARLKKYLEKRRISTDIFKTTEHAIADLFAELRDAVRTQRPEEITAILDAYERPKWRSPESCEKDFIAAKSVPA
jgi:hypothetical protein